LVKWIGLDRVPRSVTVAPFVDEDGDQGDSAARIPLRHAGHAVGSLTNDFGIRGRVGGRDFRSRRRARRIDSIDGWSTRTFAHMHRRRPLRAEQLQVAIIGAGATGVELAAELHNTTRSLVSYGLDRIDPEKDMRLILIEAADRILPALPPRLSDAATNLLAKLNVNVRTSARVAEVLPDGVRLASGEVIPAELVVWAAGVKAPIFSKTSTDWKPIASIIGRAANLANDA
jgi:NADH dehydrogenase